MASYSAVMATQNRIRAIRRGEETLTREEQASALAELIQLRALVGR